MSVFKCLQVCKDIVTIPKLLLKNPHNCKFTLFATYYPTPFTKSCIYIIKQHRGNKSHFQFLNFLLVSGLCKHVGVPLCKLLMKTELSPGHSRQLQILAQSRFASVCAHGQKWQSASDMMQLSQERTILSPSKRTQLA